MAALCTIDRYEVRPGARDAAARAMHEHASFVRRELPDVTWTAYRDPVAPTRHVASTRAETRAGKARHRQALAAALAPHLVGETDITGCELVTSSDLQRRHRR
jgi:hypothetical protein